MWFFWGVGIFLNLYLVGLRSPDTLQLDGERCGPVCTHESQRPRGHWRPIQGAEGRLHSGHPLVQGESSVAVLEGAWRIYCHSPSLERRCYTDFCLMRGPRSASGI